MKMECGIVRIILLTLASRSIESAKILCVMPTPSYNHQIMFRPLWNELLRRGHELTLLTTDPMKNPSLENLTEFDWSLAYKIEQKKYKTNKLIRKRHNFNVSSLMGNYLSLYDEIMDRELSYPPVQELIRNESAHFDLLLVEYYTPIMFAFSSRFDCPFIALAAPELPSLYHGSNENWVHPAFSLEQISLYDGGNGENTILGRFVSTLHWLRIKCLHYWKNTNEELMRQHFGIHMPPLEDIVQNISLLFINVNPSLHSKPVGPSTVLIGGGIHLEPVKELPEDVNKFMELATMGVIYVSFGSSVKSTEFDLLTFMEAFRELPYQVLWKYEGDPLPEKPDNVKMAKCLPQRELLLHRNMKIFITEGSLHSIDEGISTRTPMVVVPLNPKYNLNAKRVRNMGFGIDMSKNNITKEALKNTILGVAEDQKYKQELNRIAETYQDQPMSGLEKAVWWTEYVIRHKGAGYLSHPVTDTSAYLYYLWDVCGFIMLLPFLNYFANKILSLLYTSIMFFIRKLFLYEKPKVKLY